jgi:hypothetical protein
VIVEANEALSALLGPELPAGTTVVFTGHAEASGGAVLHVQLQGVREDTRGLAADWEDVRDATGVLLARRPPVRRFELAYVVTASATDPGREAAVLDGVLRAVVPGQRLATRLLSGALAEAGLPVLARLADSTLLPWTGRGALAVVLEVPLVRPVETALAPPAEALSVDLGRASAPPPGASPSRRWRSPRAGAPAPGAPEGGPGAVRRQAG